MPVRLRTALVVLVLGLAAGVAGVAVCGRLAPGRLPDAPARSASAPDAIVALTVLREWDARRAEVWAAGDTGGLAQLYTAGSSAGRADVALLRRYLARGLVVRGMRMQLLSARVLTSRPRTVVVEVTDRLASAVAYGASAAARYDARPLPRDAATAHRLVLRRVGGEWRMARVSVAADR